MTENSNTVSVTITVGPVNDAPIALPIKLWLPKVELLPPCWWRKQCANDTDAEMIPLRPYWFPG
jgi:hypothetical protein